MTPRLLQAPIMPALLRLSAPGLLLVAFQSMVSIGDTYFVGRLGTAPLAGLALVFPLLMLLQMTSAGAITVWLANTLSSVLRGNGNMLVPALGLIGAAAIHVPLSGSLVLGLGPMPRLGIAGAAIAYVFTFGLAAVAMAVVVFRPASALRPRRADLVLEKRLFEDILRVGGLSVLNAFQTVLTAVALTGFVGRHGAAALAGYGVGVRLELLQIPLVFAVGQALVVLVGTNIGGGRTVRAKQIAWVGALLAAGICLLIGGTVAVFPLAWVGLFSADPAVLDAGRRYLQIVAPFYPLLGVGIALYFGSQGAGPHADAGARRHHAPRDRAGRRRARRFAFRHLRGDRLRHDRRRPADDLVRGANLLEFGAGVVIIPGRYRR